MNACHSVAIKIAWRELAGKKWSKPYYKVPKCLRIPIESILDSAQELKGCVLLGFTQGGDHLISYTSTPVAAADGIEGYCLQLWSYDKERPCCKLWNVPLFRESFPEHPEDEDDFSAATGALRVTVSEPPGSELLVVHGCPSDISDLGDDLLLNHLTIIPGPRFAEAARRFQVAHLSYHTAAPHPPFDALRSLVLPPLPTSALLNGSTAAPVVLACNLGDSLRLLNIKVTAFMCPENPPRAALPGSDGDSRRQLRQESADSTLLAQYRQQMEQEMIEERGDGRHQQEEQQGNTPQTAAPWPTLQLHLMTREAASLAGPSAPTSPSYFLEDGNNSTTGPQVSSMSVRALPRWPRQPAAYCVSPCYQGSLGAAVDAGSKQYLWQQPGSSRAEGHSRGSPFEEAEEAVSDSHLDGAFSGDSSAAPPSPVAVAAGAGGAGTSDDDALDVFLQALMDLRVDTVMSSCQPIPSRPPTSLVVQTSLPYVHGFSADQVGSLNATEVGPVVAACVERVGASLYWEKFAFEAVQQQGLPLQSLQDYAVALATQGAWRGQAGLLAVVLLQLRGQEQEPCSLASQCQLVHISTVTGRAETVEVLRPPYPWQADLVTALQAAGWKLPGLRPPLEEVAAFVGDWLRDHHSIPALRRQVPHVLTNRSVINEGRSLRYITHPWLPQCIEGYGSRRRSQEEG